MRKCLSLALLVAFSWIGVSAQDARAGVTVDALFRDGTGHLLTISPGDMTGGGLRTMDIVLTSAVDLIGFGVSVTYDTDNGLALSSMVEWRGIGVEFDKSGDPLKSCFIPGGLTDLGGVIQSFDCLIAPPVAPPVMAAGTYNIGTIIWDTSSVTEGAEAIVPWENTLIDGFVAVIDGSIELLASTDIVMNGAVIGPDPDAAFLPEPDPVVIPEPDPPVIPEPEPVIIPDPVPVPVVTPDPGTSVPGVPEPSAATLMSLGLLVLFLTVRRRRG